MIEGERIREEDIRQEMDKLQFDPKKPTEAISFLAGLVVIGGELSIGRSPKLSVTLRRRSTALLAANCLVMLYDYHVEIGLRGTEKQRGTYTLELPADITRRVLLDCHLLKVSPNGEERYLLGTMASMRWAKDGFYCAALYLECGRMYNGSDYRLDLVLPFDSRRQKELETIFTRYKITAHQIPGKDKLRLSIRRESVAAFLALIGAPSASLAVTEYYFERNINRSVTRRINCSTNNMDKAYTAAARQLCAVRLLVEKGVYFTLDADVRAVGDLRLVNPDASMQKLADALGINKTAVYRRMKVIEDAASAYEGE